MNSSSPNLIYLGRSRLKRSRANLIQTFSTVEAFADSGVKVRLWLPAWGDNSLLTAKFADIGVRSDLDVRGSALLHPRWKFWPFILLHYRQLAKAGILYTRVPEISVCLGRFGLKHQLEIHDVDALLGCGLGSRIIKLQQQGLLQTLIPISNGAAQRLFAAGAVSERLHIAPSGVRLEAYAGLPDFAPEKLSRPHIVHIGRLTRERGSEIIKALAAQDWCEVTVVGGEEPLPGVNTVPIVPLREVPDWYGKSDLTVIPYQPEIGTVATMSPIKLFEALAAGRPIIASDLPTIREILIHEKNALLVAPGDIQGWLKAVQRLRDNPGMAAELGAAAKKLAPRYSWQARAQGILHALELQKG